MTAIEVNYLSKSYGGKEVLKETSFNVADSEIFGFLGPNGAGKTTTIKILTTLITPSSGCATVLGYDIRSQAAQIRKRIAVVQQQESYEQNLSVENALDMYGLLWNVPRQRRKALVEELLEIFGMKDVRKVKSIDLSIGKRRRLQVAREFMHDMDLLFLDEPTTGLDPIARRAALDFFKDKARNGLTIFFTTHILEEVEYMCDRIALINDGKIITIDSPDNIKRKFGKAKAVELRIKQRFTSEFMDMLKAIDAIEGISFRDNETIVILSSTPEEVLSHVVRAVEKFGLDISSIHVSEPSLEEAFINIMKQGGV
jgi:ABC-2 type transport system ATP-binding protein